MITVCRRYRQDVNARLADLIPRWSPPASLRRTLTPALSQWEREFAFAPHIGPLPEGEGVRFRPHPSPLPEGEGV